MTWKIGVLWGILLTVVEWLGYLAARGGVAWATQAVSILSVVLLVYVGNSVFRITRRVLPALLTTLLSALMAGFFGTLASFLVPGAGVLNVIESALSDALLFGLLGVLLGLIGALWARIGLIVKRGAQR